MGQRPRRATVAPRDDAIAPTAPGRPDSGAALLDVRARLLQRISELLDAPSRAFLESVEREAPHFSLIELPHAADLPGVRRKLTNLGQRSAAKRTADYEQLTTFLAARDRP